MPTVQSLEDIITGIKDEKIKVLGMGLEKHSSITPGHYVPRADAKNPPTFTFPVTGSGPYLVVELDLDPPFTSLPFMGPILHMVQHDLRPSAATGDALTAPADTPDFCPYHPPGPPPLAAPHRYLFVLYEQPADFDHKKFMSEGATTMARTSRVRFGWDKWASEAKLGAPLAANYYTSN